MIEVTRHWMQDEGGNDKADGFDNHEQPHRRHHGAVSYYLVRQCRPGGVSQVQYDDKQREHGWSHIGSSGRTSMVPPTRMVGMRFAIDSASSRSLHSTR